MALSKQGLVIISTYIAHKYRISLADLLFKKELTVGSIPFANPDASDEMNEAKIWGCAGLLVKHMIELQLPLEPSKSIKDAIDSVFESMSKPSNKYRDLCAEVDNHFHFDDEAEV